MKTILEILNKHQDLEEQLKIETIKLLTEFREETGVNIEIGMGCCIFSKNGTELTYEDIFKKLPKNKSYILPIDEYKESIKIPANRLIAKSEIKDEEDQEAYDKQQANMALTNDVIEGLYYLVTKLRAYFHQESSLVYVVGNLDLK